jgi:hypothetical protein
MNDLLSPLEVDKANTTPSAYWASIRLRLILSVDLLPKSLSKLVASTHSPEAGDALMGSLSCGSLDGRSQRLCDVTYPFIVEATEEW